MARRWCAAVGLFWAATLSAQTATRTTWDGVFTKEQATEGEAVYQEHCSTCHGPNLEGGEDAPPLMGAQFSAIWDGRPIGDLVRRMQARMPKDAPGSLGRNAYANIGAFLLSSNGFPAGSVRLPSDVAALNPIRYLTIAP